MRGQVQQCAFALLKILTAAFWIREEGDYSLQTEL